jgi:hypothetical protein
MIHKARTRAGSLMDVLIIMGELAANSGFEQLIQTGKPPVTNTCKRTD